MSAGSPASQAILGRFRDPVRLGLQGAGAVAATYAVMTWAGWDHLSWALISALFVLQLNSDATRRSHLGRLMGAVIGSVIGLAAVALMPGEALVAARLTAAAFAALVVAVVRPDWRYAVVGAVAVGLEPSDPAWFGALERVRAIAVGSMAGLAAAVVIWPEGARVRAERALAEALDRCRDLADLLLRAGADLSGPDRPDDLHGAFLETLRIARARVEDCRGQERRRLDALVRRVRRIWHDLVVLDRLSGLNGGADLSPGAATRRRICEALDAQRRRLASDRPAPAVEVELSEVTVGRTNDARVVFRFALNELEKDIQALAGEIGQGR